MLAVSMFSFGLLPLAALKAAKDNEQWAITAGLLSLARRNRPLLLTTDRAGLHLAPQRARYGGRNHSHCQDKR